MADVRPDSRDEKCASDFTMSDWLLFVAEVEKLLTAVAALPVELKDPARAEDGGALGTSYNRVWCWLNSPLRDARKL